MADTCQHTDTHESISVSPVADGKITTDKYCSDCGTHLSTKTE